MYQLSMYQFCCVIYITYIAQSLEYFFFIIQLLLIMTRLRATDINKTFHLYIKIVYEVITLHQPQEKYLSKIWQSNLVVFQSLHQIETKGDESEK